MSETLSIQNDKLVKKILVSYAVTFILINFADSLSMVVDGMVVSRGLGPISLAAIGLADPSYKIASLFSGVIAIGLQSLCAQAMGSGDKKKTNGIFAAGMIVTILVAVFLTTIGLTCTDFLCCLFGAKRGTELYQQLYEYLRGWFIGIPGYILFFSLSPIVTLDGNKKLVTVATFTQSFMNICGDIVAVFFFHTQANGVGFVTGMSYNVSAVILLLNFFSKHSVFHLFSESPDFQSIIKTVSIGLPTITKYVCRILSPLLINRTIISIGASVAMSAMSVKSSIFGFCVIIGNGIAESVGLLTQILYNEKDAVSLKQTLKTSLKIHLSLDFILSSLIFIFARQITSFYFDPFTEEYNLTIIVIRCLALSLPINGCNMILMKYLQSARKMVVVHIYTFCHNLFSLLVCTLIFGKLFGTIGLFVAIPVSELVNLIGYLTIILFSSKRKDAWSSILMIPDDFGYNSENSFSVSISTIEEAVAVSEKIEEFCNSHHVNKRTSFYSARCMEELATNVISREMIDQGKDYHCDIRVMIEPDEVVLRIRDDCPYYNIRERYDDLADDDIDAGVWIRLVFALAKDVNYINIFHTNTLIIRM